MMKYFLFLKGFFSGIFILIAGNLLYFGVLYQINYHEFLRLLLIFTPLLSGCVSSVLVPQWKILIGTSMGFWGAVIGVLASVLYQALGFAIDSIGSWLQTFIIIFCYQVVLSLIGSIIGFYLSRNKATHEVKSKN